MQETKSVQRMWQRISNELKKKTKRMYHRTIDQCMQKTSKELANKTCSKGIWKLRKKYWREAAANRQKIRLERNQGFCQECMQINLKGPIKKRTEESSNELEWKCTNLFMNQGTRYERKVANKIPKRFGYLPDLLVTIKCFKHF